MTAYGTFAPFAPPQRFRQLTEVLRTCSPGSGIGRVPFRSSYSLAVAAVVYSVSSSPEAILMEAHSFGHSVVACAAEEQRNDARCAIVAVGSRSTQSQLGALEEWPGGYAPNLAVLTDALLDPQ